MPIYEPRHVEYNITSGHIRVALDDGTTMPAYWAHPTIATRFPGIALVHDWWGVTPLIRLMAQQFAQVGHYVIVPDLFNGQVATTHSEALALLDALGDSAYQRLNFALTALENHHHCNGDVAAVGLGMGGSLAFEAAIMRPDLEAVVAYAGFPQRYLGYFHRSNTPILAFYGTQEQYIPAEVINRLRDELATSPHKLPHEVVMLQGVDHELFVDDPPPAKRAAISAAWNQTLDFLSSLLEGPNRPPDRKAY
jgi:carboxymethylenebutenolidase